MKNQEKLEKLWAKEKYFVLSKSQKHYQEIRESLKGEMTEEELREKIIQAKKARESPGQVVNAYSHIWGYFKKQTSQKEKEVFLQLIEEYRKGKIDQEKVLAYLKRLLKKYPNTYLENSSLFKKKEG